MTDPKPFLLAVIGRPDIHAAPTIGRFLDWVTRHLTARGEPVALFLRSDGDEFDYLMHDWAKRAGVPVFRRFSARSTRPAELCHGLAAVPGAGDRATWDAVEFAADYGRRVRVLANELPRQYAKYPLVRAVHPRDCAEELDTGTMPWGRCY